MCAKPKEIHFVSASSYKFGRADFVVVSFWAVIIGEVRFGHCRLKTVDTLLTHEQGDRVDRSAPDELERTTERSNTRTEQWAVDIVWTNRVSWTECSGLGRSSPPSLCIHFNLLIIRTLLRRRFIASRLLFELPSDVQSVSESRWTFIFVGTSNWSVQRTSNETKYCFTVCACVFFFVRSFGNPAIDRPNVWTGEIFDIVTYLYNILHTLQSWFSWIQMCESKWRVELIFFFRLRRFENYGSFSHWITHGQSSVKVMNDCRLTFRKYYNYLLNIRVGSISRPLVLCHFIEVLLHQWRGRHGQM